jgi:hypothetical protein
VLFILTGDVVISPTGLKPGLGSSFSSLFFEELLANLWGDCGDFRMASILVFGIVEG